MSKSLPVDDDFDRMQLLEDPSGDVDDLAQLKFRIPNPKVYMARQSQWVGRRGKPRCDHCRSNNLKCDRVLPTCNHCSWANQRPCRYTPLPTPAHRGIPRCDRCREKNLKCDRNLPICNNCKGAASGTSCNYTPKKRHTSQDNVPEPASPAAPPSTSLTSPRKWSKLPIDMKVEPPEPKTLSFYARNMSSSRGRSGSSLSDSISDVDSNHTGRFTADFAQPGQASSSSMTDYQSPQRGRQMQPSPPKTSTSGLAYVARQPNQAPKSKLTVKAGAGIEPWAHPYIISLPSFAIQRLRNVEPVEMPRRHEFDAALEAFQKDIIPGLRETALFSVVPYSHLAKGLEVEDATPLKSERLRSWTAVHRLCSGSEDWNLVLVPRDSVFTMDAATAEADRKAFVEDLLNPKVDVEKLQVHHYDRLPVQEQLYDILTYAHRSHLPAAQMLVEVVRLRFASITWPMAEMYVKMCPLCHMRTKQAQEKAHQSASPLP